jgi:hypothetical protein
LGPIRETTLLEQNQLYQSVGVSSTLAQLCLIEARVESFRQGKQSLCQHVLIGECFADAICAFLVRLQNEKIGIHGFQAKQDRSPQLAGTARESFSFRELFDSGGSRLDLSGAGRFCGFGLAGVCPLLAFVAALLPTLVGIVAACPI